MDAVLPPSSLGLHDRTRGGNSAFANLWNDYSHISDPNLRRRLALTEIDKVPFGLYHVRAVLVAGAGFFLDSYDIFAINLITTLLGVVYWSGDEAEDGLGGNNGQLPNPVNQALKASTSGGIVVGMILFGWLADVYGRRRMYGIELGIIILCTLGCALASSSPAITASGLLIFWRVVMGIGIGGDYPLSSVITAEFAPTRWRGGMIAAVFSMQGLGQLFCALVALFTTVGFKNSLSPIPNESQCTSSCRVSADMSWRIIVGVGAVPACLAMYYRITIPETPRYTFDIQNDVEKADADIRAYVASKSKGEFDELQQIRLKKLAGPALSVPKASWKDLWEYFGAWENMKVLIGTTMSWFFLDLAFYGLGLNNTIVLQATGFGNGSNLYEKLFNHAVGLIVLTCAGSLPGYWTAILTIDTVGRRTLQILGFFFLTIIFCILGFGFDHLSKGSFLALYIIGNFFFNAGPNTTTFIIPGECFPTRYRATGHGVSAAMGKIGAIIAQAISIPLLHGAKPPGCQGAACSPNLDKLLKLFALFMFLGLLTSLLIPETKGMTLEELSGETRTSYNADHRTATPEPSSTTLQHLNPFAGGKPAGFKYPRSRPRGFRNRNRGHQRVGIMTPPERMSQDAGTAPRKQRFFHRKDRPGTDIALSSRSSGGTISQETYASPADREAPSWGAGWGRVRQEDGVGPVSAAELRDVGALLNE
ncbi:hypothetical protein NLU13_5920 [Sarocladium strictum]|uniref:Major facilitator superfamily (MFS) profile domain-containing protein n=1 Tax=Sarocladium strictum TaxID=5046 RepID=A0AA39GG77_SARSR|nr:hypothetical protein NLU13_5920 [Sarocladium strictum]